MWRYQTKPVETRTLKIPTRLVRCEVTACAVVSQCYFMGDSRGTGDGGGGGGIFSAITQHTHQLSCDIRAVLVVVQVCR